MAQANDRAANRAYRLGILSRTVAAILGSYALAIAASFAVAALLGGRDGVQLGVMIGFILYACAAIWAFSTRSAARAWLGVIGATGLSLLLYLVAGGIA